MPTFHLLISGEVQGVFYRATAKQKARKLGVKGWVKNTDAGDVEALVTGDKQAVEQFINWCREGPEKARVENVIVTEKEETQFKDFVIERD